MVAMLFYAFFCALALLRSVDTGAFTSCMKGEGASEPLSQPGPSAHQPCPPPQQAGPSDHHEAGPAYDIVDPTQMRWVVSVGHSSEHGHHLHVCTGVAMQPDDKDKFFKVVVPRSCATGSLETNGAGQVKIGDAFLPYTIDKVVFSPKDPRMEHRSRQIPSGGSTISLHGLAQLPLPEHATLAHTSSSVVYWHIDEREGGGESLQLIRFVEPVKVVADTVCQDHFKRYVQAAHLCVANTLGEFRSTSALYVTDTNPVLIGLYCSRAGAGHDAYYSVASNAEWIRGIESS